MAKEIEKIQEKSPFSAYDFFGCLLPGLILIISLWVLLVIEGLWEPTKWPVPLQEMRAIINDLSRQGSVSKAVLLVFGIAGVYVLGHVVATLSHLVLDRFFMQRVIGYPTQAYLRLKNDGYFQSCGYVVAYTFIMLSIISSIASAFSTIHAIWFRCISAGLMFVSGIAIITVICLALMKKIVISNRGRNSDFTGGALARQWRSTRLVRLWLNVYRFTFGSLVSFLRSLLSLDKAFCPDLQSGIIRQIEKDFGISKPSFHSDAFWLVYYRTAQLSPSVDAQIRNWVNILGYSRNFAFAAIIPPLALALKQIGTGQPATPVEAGFSFAFFLLFVIFTIRYIMIYTSHYTKNTLRAYFALSMGLVSARNSSVTPNPNPQTNESPF